MDSSEWEVVWSGRDELLPPRDQRPQEPQPKVKEKRMYHKRCPNCEHQQHYFECVVEGCACNKRRSKNGSSTTELGV